MSCARPFFPVTFLLLQKKRNSIKILPSQARGIHIAYNVEAWLNETGALFLSRTRNGAGMTFEQGSASPFDVKVYNQWLASWCENTRSRRFCTNYLR
jgi:hypothetical protein